MRLFIYELVSAGGLGRRVPSSLRAEGAAMLAALVADCSGLANIEIVTLLDDAFPTALGHDCRRTDTAHEQHAYRATAADADAAIIIAPEFDDLLATRSQGAQDAGCRLLGCSPAAIRLAGDKLQTQRRLAARGIPTPRTERCGTPPADMPWPVVVKPRHGAGSQATMRIERPEDLKIALDMARTELPKAEFIVQPFHAGQPASVGLFMGPRQIVPTPGALQTLSSDGRFRYLGGTAPLPQTWRQRAVSLALRAVEGMEGLLGYVGVDVILGDEPDGSEDVVIEINPRLTTSYLGLRQLTRCNLAELWRRVAEGLEVAPPSWSNSLVRFTPDGRIEER
jgi:predicted ATP-grasp superfamily ATP-dependent carboligase